MKLSYSMVIQWSDEDQVYVVVLPEFEGAHTHGATYAEAARKGVEALQSSKLTRPMAGGCLNPSSSAQVCTFPRRA